MSDSMSPCPVCGGPLTHARQISLCGGCHGSIMAASTAKVSSTGEFAALTTDEAGNILGAPAVPAATAPRAAVACTWCSKPREQVKKLLQGNQVAICNECVALCADIMSAELGDDWR
jgi:hypothetical protein